MSEKIQARAVVNAILEIHPEGLWGSDVNVDHIHRQGLEAALGMLRTALAQSGGRIRLVGVPTVKTVTFDAAAPAQEA